MDIDKSLHFLIDGFYRHIWGDCGRIRPGAPERHVAELLAESYGVKQGNPVFESLNGTNFAPHSLSPPPCVHIDGA